MVQVSYNPQQSYGRDVAQSALQRWLGTQREAKGMFGSAEQPLQESVQMFQPGGGYGKGQAMLLQEQARQAQAEALSTQVSTGMSSGSLATGTGLRVKRDLAQGLAGVEDVRTQFLTQALQSLSGLRGQRAQTLATTQDPTYAPYMGYVGQRQGQVAAQNVSIQGQRKQRKSLSQFMSEFDVRNRGGGGSGGAYSTMQF
jgi:hypothetical protein